MSEVFYWKHSTSTYPENTNWKYQGKVALGDIT